MLPLTFFCTQFNAQQLLFNEFLNITHIFDVIHNYINIAVYGVFFFCLFEFICNSTFAPNTASLSRLLFNGSYLSRFSINVSVCSFITILYFNHLVQKYWKLDFLPYGTNILHHNFSVECSKKNLLEYIKIATDEFTVLIWKVRSYHIKYIGDDSFAIQRGNRLNF